jgi:NYN domain
MITNVYIDGFNLYYGCLKRTPYRWLDLGAMCAKLLPSNEIKRIRYFTARVKAREDDPLGPARQEAYLAAIGTIPGVSIHYGHFLASKTKMALVNPPPAPAPHLVQVHKMEEKGSDVNLATWLLIDSFEKDCEMAVVVTNDSDLALPIRMASRRLGVPVGLINPHPRDASRALVREQPVFVKSIRRGVLASSQLPPQVTAGRRVLHRPTTW